nr:hypothetical protein [Falsirhodobacter halotolerans]
MNEVASELRRDRLFGALKRYGWIAAVVVVAIAGGAAWNEWQRRENLEASRQFGDRMLAALDAGTPEERRAELQGDLPEGLRGAIQGLMAASDPGQDKAATLAALDQVIARGDLPPVYHDLAVLRKVIVAGPDLPLDERRALLTPLTGPGQPYRALAQEQMAYLQVEGGDTAGAIETLQSLTTEQDAPMGLRQRAEQMAAVLGGETPAAE